MQTTDRQNPITYLFSKTWRYSEGNHGKIVLFWIMFIVGQSINVFVPPLVFAKIINVITKQGITPQSIHTLSWLLAFVMLRAIVFWGIHGPARWLEQLNAFKARSHYRRFLLKGVMTMPLEWHKDHHSGDTIDRIEKGTNGLYAFSEESYENIYASVKLLGSYAMLVYFSHSASYVVIIMMALSIWITMRFDRVLIDRYRQLNRSENQISESVFDAVSNISTVIILRVEKLVFNAIMKKVEKPYKLFRKTYGLDELKWFLTSFCCNGMTVIVLGLYFFQHFGEGPGVSVGSIYILINYLDQIAELMFHFAGAYSNTVQRKAKVMNSEELTKDFRPENFTNHVLPENWQNLQIENLSFSYHNDAASELHLEDITLSLNKGERIAFVGASGSGKTTLLKVIRDLYHPRQLVLKVDGNDIPHGFEGIARAIALVPQNPEIFATSVLENITLGAEYDMDFVRRFTDMACFTEIAESLPNKFDSSIKEKGVNLSGGQQQRLALSRGLLACHDKDIVLLDEPTSSLDTANEMKVYRNIFEGFQGKTIISSIHRLHLLPSFDTIYMFKDGKIASSGSLPELLDANPEFQELWQHYQSAEQTIQTE